MKFSFQKVAIPIPSYEGQDLFVSRQGDTAPLTSQYLFLLMKVKTEKSYEEEEYLLVVAIPIPSYEGQDY